MNNKLSMVKVGQKVKGFRFKDKDNSSMLNWSEYNMAKYIGVEGTIMEIIESLKFNDKTYINYFSIQFGKYNEVWSYPIQEYLEYMRDEKLYILLG